MCARHLRYYTRSGWWPSVSLCFPFHFEKAFIVLCFLALLGPRFVVHPPSCKTFYSDTHVDCGCSHCKQRKRRGGWKKYHSKLASNDNHPVLLLCAACGYGSCRGDSVVCGSPNCCWTMQFPFVMISGFNINDLQELFLKKIKI